MSEASAPKTPPALPKPQDLKKHYWHGIGLHTLLTLAMLIGFSILLPWIFPGVLQSPINLDPIEKKVKDFERILTGYAPITQGDLEQLRSTVTHLEQKLADQSALVPSSSTKAVNLIPLSLLLRLEQAVLLGYSYDSIWAELKTLFSIQAQDFPTLERYQQTGVSVFPLDLEQGSLLSQATSDEAIPFFSHPWTHPLSNLIKIRKHKSETPQEAPSTTLATLIKRHKFEEALELLQKSSNPQADHWRQHLQNYVTARKELQLLWKRWQEDVSQPAPSQEKSS
jgi:hypothetical protein